LDRHTFERLVTEALDRLPEFFREKLNNVAVVVEDWPDPEALQAANVRHPAELLGLYRGVPQTKRTHHYGLVLPDKITVYQRPIEMRCRTVEQVRSTIGQVLRHEVAHHFGIGDERLRQLVSHDRHKPSDTAPER
jgi:predicted Zn-dependent protease with MMP-like domain